ncbi:MAG: T9SS type A sorting domain-containing protein [bacterium]
MENMIKSFTRFLVTMVVGLLLIQATAQAQIGTGGIDPRSLAALKDLVASARDWAQTDVIPQMKAWKTKLDETMTVEDLASLNKLREQAKSLDNQKQRVSLALQIAIMEKKTDEAKALKEKLAAIGKEQKGILIALKPIAEKNKETLIAIGTDSKSFAKQWKENVGKLLKEWYEKNQSIMSDGMKKLVKLGVDKLKQANGIAPELRGKMAAAKFMLWDGSDLPTVDQLMLRIGTGMLALNNMKNILGTDRKFDQPSVRVLNILLKSIHDWAQQNVVPRLRRWKGGLDNAMAQEDLRALNSLRDRAASLKQREQRITNAIKDATTRGDRTTLQSMKEKLEEVKKSQKALLEELKPIAVKYKSTLEEIGKVAKPAGQQWKEDVAKIGKDWYAQYENVLGDKAKLLLKFAVERTKKMDLLGADLKAKLRLAKFMLWDGKDMPEFKGISEDGTLEQGAEEAVPEDGYKLEANYPNPFNPTTTIEFILPQAERVTLRVYDMLGREVRTLVDAEVGAGTHTVVFDGKNLSSGVYIYRLQAGNVVKERQMQLLK